MARRRDPRSRYLLVDDDGQVLADADAARPMWLSARQLPSGHAGALSLLGVDDSGAACFMLRLGDLQVGLDDGVRAVDLRSLGETLGPADAGWCAYAVGLARWQAGTRYCPSCGASVVWCDAGHRAQCSNKGCDRAHFPRVEPAIIVIVEHDGACLLGRQARWPQGRYSTLAGFVEPGEALEDAVRREVYEEAGVRVVACRYHSSQPWPFPAALMAGFTATAADRDIALRDGELEDARWFTPQQIVDGVTAGSLLLSSPVSVSWHLLDYWMRQRAGIRLRDLQASALG